VVVVLVLGVSGAGTEVAAQAHYEGAIGPGADYEIDVPATWNGDLVLYAHGIVQASLPVALPSSQDNYAAIRGDLLAAGFAVAASSYSSNGWALADAVRRTHQLSGIVASQVGQPRRTFLLGHSMGALAIVKLAERYPRQYDGALAICGPLGGGLAELQYAGDARVTFEHYFPGVLPGAAFDVPPGTEYRSPFEPGGPSPLFLSVFTALSANPAATFQWATAAKLPFINQTELGNSSLYVIGFLLRYTNDLIERVNGKLPFDNQGVEYQVTVSPDPAINAFLSAQLNEGVERFTADGAALNFYEHNYTPSGQLEIPVMTLHTTRDPAIPIGHETMFAASVAAAGRSDWLVQRSVNRWGHCALSPGEVGAAFHDLVGWVNSGQRP
jgi:pimeloyl-ACP methyl ester carboxylesterase